MGKRKEGSSGRFTARDHARINEAAIASAPVLFKGLFPNGKSMSREFRRNDRNLGSLKINRYDCRWHDFATGDEGETPISLLAYVAGIPESEAARLLAQMVEPQKLAGLGRCIEPGAAKVGRGIPWHFNPGRGRRDGQRQGRLLGPSQRKACSKRHLAANSLGSRSEKRLRRGRASARGGVEAIFHELVEGARPQHVLHELEYVRGLIHKARHESIFFVVFV